ncbi:helix-turn-helix domain-containing protein [Streptomyces sp. MMG1533]|uniref:nSTAND1 domain-containing NTPase n=1 Tax=Streptomyces sp. MMG1533 TaxID=1415546 RepID=UPI0007C64ACD|nr:helix-turn-helix domain-containing protein [Streptomyces sp. MMG1533]
MGRREKPLDPDAGPVQRLAHELRLLREKAGKPPYREMAERAGYSTTALSQAAAGDQLPSLPLVRAYAQVLDADPDEWERRWREADAQVRTPSAEERTPYRGLARFEPGDSDLFFGRDKQVEELLGLVRAHRFAAVFGPSGSGKSSLLRAGLIPALRQAQGADRPAVIRVLTPGEQPARAHEQALVPKDGDLDTWVIVDQFEELFTLCHDRDERARFLDLLLRAREPESRLRVAIAVRGDFYGHCGTHQELAETVSHANLLVGPLSRDELRDVITRPATAEGLNVERALTARVIDEVTDQPGALPMLSHALLETWRRRRGRTLTLAAYEEAGGVHGAIAATAEQVYAELSPEQARTARRILLRLITPGDGAPDTRRPASRAELGPDAQDVLESLATARLVTLDGDTVELAHEVLITGWPRLAGWIEESRERLRAQRLLGESARTWEQLDRDPGALYRGARLTQAEELFTGQHQDDLAEQERAFLDASRAARDAEREAGTRATRRTRLLTMGLSAFLVLALAAGLLAWQRDRASDEEAAKAAARRLATVADSLRSADPRTAALLSVAAWRLAPLTESRSALLDAQARPERDAFTDPQTGENTQRFLTDQGRALITVTGTEATVRDVADHRVTATYRLPGGTEVTDADFDARSVVLTGQDGDEVWNLAARRLVAALGDAAHWAAPDGSAYASGPSDGTGPVKVHRTGDGKVLFTTETTRTLTAAAVGPGGHLLALCPADGAPQVWDTVHGKQLPGSWEKADGTVCGTGSGADGGSRLLELSGDGHRLAVISGNTARVWNVAGGRQVADFQSGGTSGFTQAVLSPDGRFLATADDQEIAAWSLDPDGGSAFHTPLAGAEVSDLTWAPGGNNRTLRYLDGATVRTYDLSDRLNAHWQSTPADATALSPDGTVLATATRSGSGSGSGYRLELRSTRTNAVLARTALGALPGDGVEETPPLAFSPDGRALAVADTVSSHGSLRQRFSIWDVPAHRVRTSFETSGAADRIVSALALGTDGRTLLAARSTSGDGTAEVWDTAAHRRTATLSALNADRLALRPDGRLLVGSADRYAGLPSGHVSGRALADGRQVTALAFSPDGTRLAVGDSTGHVTLWDGDLRHRMGILTGTSDTVSTGEPEAVGALAFSPDGGTLAVGGHNGTLRLWDTAGQRLLGGDLPTPGAEIDTLAFTGDGATLYAGGPDVLLQSHPVAGDDVARILCERAGGGLTEAQWRTYVPDAPYRPVCPTTH